MTSYIINMIYIFMSYIFLTFGPQYFNTFAIFCRHFNIKKLIALLFYDWQKIQTLSQVGSEGLHHLSFFSKLL